MRNSHCNTGLVVLAFVLMFCAPGMAQEEEEFNWSWEQGDGKTQAPAKEGATGTAPAAAKGAEGESFDWSWNEDLPEEEAPVPAETPAPAPRVGVDASAYNELLQENLDLRKKLARAARDQELAVQEKDRLAREVRDLETRIAESVSAINKLKDQKKNGAPEDLDTVIELESRLTGAEDEKARLSGELDILRKRLADAEAAPAGGASAVKPGSDLFRKLEEENAGLRKRVEELETRRQEAVKAGDAMADRESVVEEKASRAQAREKKLESELAQVRSAEEQHRQTIKDLLRQMPDMEEELTAVTGELEKKERALQEKESELQSLRTELERREHRLVKAERMAELLEKAREEVKEVSDRQQRDMHFNMAVVYAKEGKYAEAEQEYLHTLRLDPTDGEAHYNLGILYDEELKDPRRAAMHYRKYMTLKPESPDAQHVRSWLMRLEMNLHK